MQCVAFEIDGTTYAIPTDGIEEVAPMVKARPLPDAPDWVRGVIDHRGRLVPMLDMRRLIGGESLTIVAGTRILIADVRLGRRSTTGTPAPDADDRRRIALAVGCVHEVIEIDADAAAGFDGLPGGSMPYLGRLVPMAEADATPETGTGVGNGDRGRRVVRLVDPYLLLAPEIRVVLFGTLVDETS